MKYDSAKLAHLLTYSGSGLYLSSECIWTSSFDALREERQKKHASWLMSFAAAGKQSTGNFVELSWLPYLSISRIKYCISCHVNESIKSRSSGPLNSQ